MGSQRGRACDFCRDLIGKRRVVVVRARLFLSRKSSKYVQCGEPILKNPIFRTTASGRIGRRGFSTDVELMLPKAEVLQTALGLLNWGELVKLKNSARNWSLAR